MRNPTVMLGVLLVAGVAASVGHAADKTVPACGLLTPAEVGAAVGGAVGQAHENSMVVPEGPSKGQTMGMCNWPAGGKGSVSVAVIRAPQGGREAELARFNQMSQRLKAQGWREERKDFGNGTSALMTPPASAKDMPSSTSCFAEAKGMGISVGYHGGASVAMDKIKGLLDKAIGRLP